MQAGRGDERRRVQAGRGDERRRVHRTGRREEAGAQDGETRGGGCTGRGDERRRVHRTGRREEAGAQDGETGTDRQLDCVTHTHATRGGLTCLATLSPPPQLPHSLHSSLSATTTPRCGSAPGVTRAEVVVGLCWGWSERHKETRSTDNDGGGWQWLLWMQGEGGGLSRPHSWGGGGGGRPAPHGVGVEGVVLLLTGWGGGGGGRLLDAVG